MSDQPTKQPSFSSDIPEHLLANATPESRWLMQNVSALTKKTDYLVSEQIEQSSKLVRIETQVNHTNGRLLKVEKKIDQLEITDQAENDIRPDLHQIVATKRLAGKMVVSKYFWIGIGLFIIGTYTVLTSPTLGEWLNKFL